MEQSGGIRFKISDSQIGNLNLGTIIGDVESNLTILGDGAKEIRNGLTRLTEAVLNDEQLEEGAKRELIERGTRAGRKVVLVPPAYTTMTCSECGTRAKERLGLGIRTLECSACGYTADRDLNAARTILATAERVHASADDVRHSIASFRDGGSDAVRAGNPPELSVGRR